MWRSYLLVVLVEDQLRFVIDLDEPLVALLLRQVLDRLDGLVEVLFLQVRKASLQVRCSTVPAQPLLLFVKLVLNLNADLYPARKEISLNVFQLESRGFITAQNARIRRSRRLPHQPELLVVSGSVPLAKQGGYPLPGTALDMLRLLVPEPKLQRLL
jgi:hypothetical protein